MYINKTNTLTLVFSIFSIERIKYEKEMQIMNSTSVKKPIQNSYHVTGIMTDV